MPSITHPDKPSPTLFMEKTSESFVWSLALRGPKPWAYFTPNCDLIDPHDHNLFTPHSALPIDMGLSHTCSRRIPESCAPLADPQSGTTETASDDQYLNSRRTSARIRRNWKKPGPTSYLHQIRH